MRYTSKDAPPDWCELRSFSIHRPALGETATQERQHTRERILMTRGRCQVTDKTQSQVIRAGQFLDPDDTVDEWQVTGNTKDAEFIRLSGTWSREIAGCGIWTMDNTENPCDSGDPVTYAKTTCMDRHYHDYDEYWFVLEGAATAVVGDRFYDLGEGDCLATPAGVHHDVSTVQSTMRGAFFETSLLGEKRMGHLWEHTHGAAPGSDHFP